MWLAVSLPSSHLPSSLPALSTNALVIVVIGLVVAYSLLAGYAALVRESISIYVGLVLSASFGEPLFNYLNNNVNASFVNQTTVNLALLIIPIILLQFGRKHHTGGARKHNMVLTLILAVLTAMLLVSSVLLQLGDVTISRTTDASMLASWIYDFRLLWLAAVPVAIGLSAIIKPKPHHRH